MRRLKLFTIVLLAIVALLSLGACKEAMPTPQNLDINLDTLELSWNAVQDASRYVIEITNVNDAEDIVTKTTRQTKYNIDGLLAEGDYEIKVMVQGSDNFADSAWSEILAYHQDYVSGCVYELINNNSEYQIKKGSSTRGDIVIEDVYRSKPVTAIAKTAFRGNTNLTGIVIGQNVTTIGDMAFYNCKNLKSVVLPDGLASIGESVFHNCQSLTSVKLYSQKDDPNAQNRLPDKITEIPVYAFAHCQSLPNIVVNSNITIIGESAFANCYSFTNVVIPDTIQLVNNSAFANCTLLTDVTIGQNVAYLGEYAFSGCIRLQNVNFSDSGNLKTIDKYCFYSCYREMAGETEGAPSVETGLKSIQLPEGIETINNNAFYGCVLLESVNIPSTVSFVGLEAFRNTKIFNDQIVAEAGLIYIDNWLVYCQETDATGMTQGLRYTITDLVRSSDQEGTTPTGGVMRKIREGTVGIANRAFRAAKNLTNVYLPASIKYVGNNVFARCEKLVKVIAEGNNIVSIGDYAFSYCLLLTNVQFQSGIKSIGMAAFMGSELLDNNVQNPELLVPDTVTSIGDSAFKDTAIWTNSSDVVIAGKWLVGAVSESLGAIDISDADIVGVANFALYNASSLISITGLSSAKYIGYGAFYGCSMLSAVSLNSAVKEIQPYTFFNCNLLASVSFPSMLQSIGRAAFYKCYQLTELDFSRTQINYIGLNAFYGCINLTNIKFGTKDTLTEIDNQAFYRCATGSTSIDSGLRSVSLPNSLTRLGDRAFAECYLLETIEFGSGLKAVGNYSFRNCHSLVSLTIPSTIETVGKYAFSKCRNLGEIIFEEGVTTLNDYAFYENNSLNHIVFSESLTTIGRYVFKGCRQLYTVALPKTVTNIGAHAFYGCKMLTIYTDAESELDGWHMRWNSSYRPVIFNSIFAEDNSYVTSINLKLGGFKNVKTAAEIALPERCGYVATGWDQAIPETLTEEGIVISVTWVEGYSIVYLLEGGVIEGGNPHWYYEGSETIVLINPTRIEYVTNPESGNLETYKYNFLGWYDEEGNLVTEIPQGSTGDIKLIAKWSDPILVEE